MLRDFPWVILVVITIGVLWWARARSRSKATPIDPNDPRWAEAIAKARNTVDEMRNVFADGAGEVYVKYPLRMKSGSIEHVWGKLIELSAQDMKASLETHPIGRPEGTAPFSVPLSEIEDWQFMQPDGRIRGGFTTRAQIAIARATGGKIPPHVAEMEQRFVDGPG
jgi:uncharacterized protein YegJ (DUF2314 family)